MQNGTMVSVFEGSTLASSVRLCEQPGHGPMTSDDAGPYCQRCEDVAALSATLSRQVRAAEAATARRDAERAAYVSEQERQAAVLVESVTYRKSYKGNEYSVRVESDGSVILTMPSGVTSTHKSLSAAAGAVTGSESINGRKFWGADGSTLSKPRKAAPVEVPLHERLAGEWGALDAGLIALLARFPTGVTADRLTEAHALLASEVRDVLTYHERLHARQVMEDAAEQKRTEARAKLAVLEAEAARIRAEAGL